MSSAFFRKPGEDSSDSDSDSDSDVENNESQSIEREELDSADIGDGTIELTAAETLSSTASFSLSESRDDSTIPNADHHKDLIIATLMEDLYKTRAAELINTANPGASYHRLSPEVQPLAKKLYADAAKTLTSSGILPSTVVSDSSTNLRKQYLSGLDNLSLRRIQDNDLQINPDQRRLSSADDLALTRNVPNERQDYGNLLSGPLSTLMLRSGHVGLPSPYVDLQLSIPQSRRSHYESSFQQLRFLGKGGFGRVYHAYNLFDKKEYAVKKIPLSPKLSQRYKESGHGELESVLREVQALAQLDHCNIVRYHATWLEEPRTIPPSAFHTSHSMKPVQKLLDNRPATDVRPNARKGSWEPSLDDGIVFDFDSVSQNRPVNEPIDWSSRVAVPETSSIGGSDIFTDGHARPNLTTDPAMDDSVYVLHVQMSMYPMTLAEYLAPVPSNPTRGINSGLLRRHCFHLVPALRILLGILCGLQYIHAKGLVHRDIKPSNIFISSMALDTPGLLAEGFHDVGSCPGCFDCAPHFINPRIGDFGLVADLAKTTMVGAGSEGSSPSKVVGTEYYRPPIHNSHPITNLKGKQSASVVGEKVDVFALGVILVEMLWCCTTSSERLHILRDLQKGKLPRGLAAKIEQEGHEPGIGAMVEGCVRGMIDGDPVKRFDCDQVKSRTLAILHRCEATPAKHRNDRIDVIRGLTRVRSLEESDVSET